jgi:pimeloyl-ACP methyl ester carboxylesterase
VYERSYTYAQKEQEMIMQERITHKTVATLDGSGMLSYQVEGTGAPILCLPSLGDTRRQYDRFAPALVEAGYRVITTDLRGMGASGGIFKSYKIETLADDVKAILDNEKIERAIVVGCSISGASAGLFALQQPERVIGQILINPLMRTASWLQTRFLTTLLALPGIGKMTWLTYFKSLYPARPVDAEYLEGVKAAINRPGAMQSVIKMCEAPRLDERIKEMSVPTLILLGGKDPDFKDVGKEAATLREELPTARIEVFDGIGHYPQREAPEMTMPVVLDWLKATI